MDENRCARCGKAREEIELTCPHCGLSSESLTMSRREVQRLKSGGGKKRIAYLFVVWTVNGLLIFFALAVVTKLGLFLYEVDPLLSVGLLIVALPIVLTGIGVAKFLRSRANRRRKIVQSRSSWVGVESEEIQDDSQERAEARRRLGRLERKRSWGDDPSE